MKQTAGFVLGNILPESVPLCFGVIYRIVLTFHDSDNWLIINIIVIAMVCDCVHLCGIDNIYVMNLHCNYKEKIGGDMVRDRCVCVCVCVVCWIYP